jgi:GAF domain-containing protein
LFEAMPELHFSRDSIEGAEFVLTLALDKLVSRFGLVHMYDINAREFVVVRAVAGDPKPLLGLRTSEKEPLIAQAMRARRAIVVSDAATDDRVSGHARWSRFDRPIVSVVCAPVEIGGRFLGVIELANPRDGGAFTEAEGHALTYIGEQFAEFVQARGISLESERVKA